MNPPFVLVLAKAPVAGKAKTRLTPPASPRQAAEIAAAGLLDTLTAARESGMHTVVALAGELSEAAARAEVTDALRQCSVLAQRGEGLAERIVYAHADAAALLPGSPVVQIGSDTPQVTPALLNGAARQVSDDGPDAALGQATDGGWWALALRDPREAVAVRGVPMSTPDTGRLTREALTARGLRVGGLPVLSDVDTMTTARQVSGQYPESRFARAVAAVHEVDPNGAGEREAQ